MEKPRRLWGLLHPPPHHLPYSEGEMYPTEKETVDCDGSWALVVEPVVILEPGVESVVSLDLELESWRMCGVRTTDAAPHRTCWLL